MEEPVLQFEDSEFIIEEDIDFTEEVQRPENLRFFTLDEQLADFFEKSIPSGKDRILKAEYKALTKHVDRLRNIYGKLVVMNDTDYNIKTWDYSPKISWVNHVYSELNYNKFNFTEWQSLFNSGNKTAGGYNRMLLALPRPFKSGGVSFDSKTKFTNRDGKDEISLLGNYSIVRDVISDGGNVSITSKTVLGTADEINFTGYFVGKRGLDIPKPLAQHPFLSDPEDHFIDSTLPLKEIFPHLDAILEHGVPDTDDPYNSVSPYLKLYDVSLDKIPWSIWKNKFKPVEHIPVQQKVLSVEFKHSSGETKPAENLLKIYGKTWRPNISPRNWLKQQEDGGALVAKMLLSQAGGNGRVPPEKPGEVPKPIFPKSVPTDCIIDSSFREFTESGVYRSAEWNELSKAADKFKPLPTGVCVPVDYIKTERDYEISRGKQAWNDDTNDKILKEYQKLFSGFKCIPNSEKEQKFEKTDKPSDSLMKRQVLALLGDKKRDDSEKNTDIRKLLMSINPIEHKFLEPDGTLILCEHTLAILSGGLSDDRLEFYNDWTFITEGFRTCKFCGQQINTDTLVNQEEFDELGNPIINYSNIEDRSTVGISFSKTLQELKKLFDLGLPAHVVLYMSISLLQIVPEISQLVPIIEHSKLLTAASKKVKDPSLEGAIGIAAAVTLLQTHTPFLIPRRSFGSKILKLSGFPRDTDDQKQSPAVDIVLTVLKTSLENSKNQFKEDGVGTSLRKVVAKTADMKKNTLKILPAFKKQPAIGEAFERARKKFAEVPEILPVIQESSPVLADMKTVFTSDEEPVGDYSKFICNVFSPRTYFNSQKVQKLTQDPPKLVDGIVHTNFTLVGQDDYKIGYVWEDSAETQKNLKIKPPKFMEKFLNSAWIDQNTYLSLVNRLLSEYKLLKIPVGLVEEIRPISIFLDTLKPNSEVRDRAKGNLLKLVSKCSEPELKTLFTTDLIIGMITIDKLEAEKDERDMRAKERDLFKMRMREQDDETRQLTKFLLDIGLSEFVITNADRELIAEQYKLPELFEEDRADEGVGEIADGVEGELPEGERNDITETDGAYGTNMVFLGEDEYGGLEVGDEL